jgi:wyosine [tRNA(Phe)-imidazoG37] synthetase (radical SAM superfamily)
VTNAQFPEQMESLRPCTQLYISVDAPTADEMQAAA